MVKDELADDIEQLVQFAQSSSDEALIERANRVEQWLATYRPDNDPNNI